MSNRFVLISICLLLATLNLPISIAKDSDKEVIPPAAEVNREFTPLVVPAEAKQCGISLSGSAKLYQLEQGSFQLGCGCVLVHTEEPIQVKTCRATITAKNGATVVIGAKSDATRILNLSDRKHDSVRVVFGRNYVSLNPGEEIVVLNSQLSDIEKHAMEEVIRFRNAQTLQVSPDYKAVVFEFSLTDAMKRCLIFKQLNSSPNQQDHVLLKEIIKTAAAVNTMFSKSRDKYTHGVDETKIAKAKSKQVKQIASKKRKEPPKLALSSPDELRD